MVKDNGIKKFLMTFIENFIIQLIIGLAFVLGAAYILKNYILSFFSYIQQTNIPLWITILAVILACLLTIFFKYFFKKNHGPMMMSFRTRIGNEEKIPFNFNGLNWVAFIPRQLFEPDEYVWLNGPFCPNCSYELNWRGRMNKSWYCERCNENFKTLKKSARDEKSFVENVVYADVFRKKNFIPLLSNHEHEK